jgi:hypothetical protein
MDVAASLGYQVFSATDLVPVGSAQILKVMMIKTETFLLFPLSAQS